MQQYKPFRLCPICDFDSVTSVYNIGFRLFDGHPMRSGYEVVQCRKCCFVYADTRVTQDELDIYYKDLSKYEDKNIGTGGGYTAADKDRLYKAARSIKEHVPDTKSRILDIGCANGGLLKELKDMGYENLAGVDPSLSCVEITKAEVGCEVFQFSIFNLDESLGKFDVVILSHVLEHILEVGSTMNRLLNLLNEEGIIYVECPNAENYYKVIHAPFQEYNTEHINHFTEIAFENLHGLYGFNKIETGDRVLKIASGEDYHAVYGLFKKGIKKDYQIKTDESILPNLSEYNQRSLKMLHATELEIMKFINQTPIALFGIGQFAFKLLNLPIFEGRKVLLFDNNVVNVGKTINNAPILNAKTIAEEFAKGEFSIIITSYIHEDGIRKQIEEAFSNSAKKPLIKGFKHLNK